MRVTSRRGRLLLKLEPVETNLLGSLLDQLDTVLDGEAGDGADAVRDRLFPAAYQDDPAAAAEFRSLTESTLRDERADRIARCRADLAAGPDVELTDPEAARRWIQVLNDLRLAFGTRLGVTEHDGDFDPDAPDADLRAVYYWLTSVQDSVVGALLP